MTQSNLLIEMTRNGEILELGNQRRKLWPSLRILTVIVAVLLVVCCVFLILHFKSVNSEDDPDFDYDDTTDQSTTKATTKSIKPPFGDIPGFLNFPSTCGLQNIKPRIGNGDKVELSEFPWYVVMMRPMKQKVNNVEHTFETPFCGGSLLSENLILTAAHCIKDLEHPQSYIVLGEHDLYEDPDCVTSHNNKTCADPVQRFNSSELVTIIHPHYNNETKVNDLALIKLKSPAKFSKSVAPICLPFHEKNLPQKITVAGYGATEKDFFPEVLMKMTVPIIDIEKCREKYDDKSITKNHFCAIEHKISNLGGKSFNISTDSCRGDSGSSAFFPSPGGKFVQYGIVSWGQSGGCGANFKSPGVYVSVYPYIEWILRNSYV